MSDDFIESINDHMVLIGGEADSGKSASLRNFVEPEGVVYVNSEAGKRLPFKKSKFRPVKLADPWDMIDILKQAEEDESVHSVVVDTLTFMMDMFESDYVLTEQNTQKAWGEYLQFFREFMQKGCAPSSKNLVMLAHTSDFTDDKKTKRHAVKVKGSLMDRGIESFFSTILHARCVPLSELAGYENDMLNITEDDEIEGYKYVFQTRKTKSTSHHKIRSAIDMWDRSETFIDNDINHVLRRLHEFYEE